MQISLTDAQRERIDYLWPALLAGLIAGLAFLFLGESPLLRSGGLALTITGITLAMRRMGALLSITGGLALAFSPAFWLQTGPAASSIPATVVLALGAAGLIAILIVLFSQRPYVALIIALVVFAGVFFTQIGVARSLRLTGLTSAWLIYLLMTVTVATNPRPDGPPPARLRASYRALLLLLLGVGSINDPLIVLFAPAVVLAVTKGNARIPWWYWGMMLIVTVIGMRGIFIEYIDPQWWSFPSDVAITMERNIPFLIADAWGEPLRWVGLFALIAQQFTLGGVLLGLMGLSRMARWYPVLGGVMMIAYASFFMFGIGYFGRDREILLLPLFIIQVILITYAVHAFGQWLEKSLHPRGSRTLRWIAPAVYIVLPILLLWNIMRTF